MEIIKEKATPFLRWAGGKSWLIKHLDNILSDVEFNNYYEPFLGGASVFLAIKPKNKVYLSDLNKELINTYKCLKKYPQEIIEILQTFQNDENFYYDIRNRKFDDPLENASKFIYLNQTSFNGIYRVNLKGEYNVPYGYRTKNFLEPEKLIEVSNRLKKAYISYGDFNKIKNKVKENDLVFLDPPYTVSHNHNGFIKYNQRLFSLNDQKRLSGLIDQIKQVGAYYILTNAAHDKIKEIFNQGDTLLKKQRASLIGGINAQRGQTTEYLFTNLG